MSLHALCVGPEIDVFRPQSGVVHSSFDHAVNLLMGGELWTVLAGGRQDAPFGIRLPGDRVGGLGVQVAECVHVRAGYVSLGRRVVDCRAAARWKPAPWGGPASGLDARLSLAEERARPRAWSNSHEIASDMVAALDASDEDLACAVRRSVGRGPGLTPSGDDVLVGMLAVLTSEASGPAGVRAAARLRSALVAPPLLESTPDVSRFLLWQAARGLRGRVLHDLGKALCEGATDGVLAEALEAALDTGCTSGADACLGLVAACRYSFLASRKARS